MPGELSGEVCFGWVKFPGIARFCGFLVAAPRGRKKQDACQDSSSIGG